MTRRIRAAFVVLQALVLTLPGRRVIGQDPSGFHCDTRTDATRHYQEFGGLTSRHDRRLLSPPWVGGRKFYYSSNAAQPMLEIAITPNRIVPMGK